MMLIWGFFVLLMIGMTIFWIWAIVDVATRERDEDNNRLIWLLIIIFAHWIGALIYFLVRRPERIRRYGQ